MNKKDLLLVSSVGFSSGWVPLNVGLLKSSLLAKGHTVDLWLLCLSFSEYLRKKHSNLLYIDENIGEWGYSFHEPYFAAKFLNHTDPKQLLLKTLDLKRKNRDIYKENLNKSHSLRYGAPLINGGLHDILLNYEKASKDIIEYCSLLENFIEKSLSKIIKIEYDFIGFSCNFSQFFTSLHVARAIKLKCTSPSPKVIFGGPMFYSWNASEYAKCFVEIDYVFVGESENSLHNFLLSFKCRTPKVKLTNRKVVDSSDDIHSLIDLSDLPAPDFNSTISHIRLNKYRIPTWLSRNCPSGQCLFCVDNRRPFRIREVGKVINEIKFLKHKWKVKEFGLYEPNPNGNYFKFKKLCSRIIETGLNCKFWCELNSRNTDKDLFIQMKRAGFEAIQIGVESFSDNLLRKMNKPATVVDNVKSLKWAIEAGIKSIYINLICNFPNEDDNDLIETFENIKTIAHLIRYPLIISVCEFELHRQAKIFSFLSDSQKRTVSNYEYFSLYFNQFSGENIPLPLLKIKLPQINPYWRKILLIIGRSYHDKACLSITKFDHSIIVDDSRTPNTKHVVLQGLEKEIFLILCEQTGNLRVLSQKTRHSPSELETVLQKLEENKLVLSGNGEYIGLALIKRN